MAGNSQRISTKDFYDKILELIEMVNSMADNLRKAIIDSLKEANNYTDKKVDEHCKTNHRRAGDKANQINTILSIIFYCIGIATAGIIIVMSLHNGGIIK